VSRTFSVLLFALSMFTALVVGGASVSAQAKRVAVVAFDGPSASTIQAQVIRALKQRDEIDLVSSRDVRNTAERLDNRMRSEADFRELGEALELSAFIEGKSVKKGRNLSATVTVRNAATGEILHEETWNRRRSQLKGIRPLVWDALGPAISESSAAGGKPRKGRAKPAPEPEPEPEAEEEEIGSDEEVIEEPPPKPQPRPRRPPPEPVAEEEEEPAEQETPVEEQAPARAAVTRSGAHPALVASIGPRLAWRTLQYDGPTQYYSYKNQGGSPAFSLPINLQYYPGAHFTSAWYSDLGLEVDLDYTLGLKSKLTDEEKALKTTAYEVGVGAIYRVPLSDFEPRFRVGYVRHSFEVDFAGKSALPGVTYSAVRIGAGTAIKFVDWLSFDLAFAYLFVLDAGELQKPEFAPDVSLGAWEAGAAFVLHLKEIYGVKLGIDYRRYKYDFALTDTTNEDATMLPNSGTDGYLRATLNFIFKLPGAL
jgi:TolB-like protein